jgi:hypothetical protein
MNTRTSKLPSTRTGIDIDRLARAAIAGVFAAGLLVLAACSDGVPPVVSQAFAAPVETGVAYFPTQFPSPEGAPAESIPSF